MLFDSSISFKRLRPFASFLFSCVLPTLIIFSLSLLIVLFYFYAFSALL